MIVQHFDIQLGRFVDVDIPDEAIEQRRIQAALAIHEQGQLRLLERIEALERIAPPQPETVPLASFFGGQRATARPCSCDESEALWKLLSRIAGMVEAAPAAQYNRSLQAIHRELSAHARNNGKAL